MADSTGPLKAVVINESTGEIELIEDVEIDMLGNLMLDAGGSGVAQEVEVVTIEDYQRRNQRIQQQRNNITSTTQSIVKPLVSTLLSPSSSSGTSSHHNTRSMPTLLRNSRFARHSSASVHHHVRHLSTLGTASQLAVANSPANQIQTAIADGAATIELIDYPTVENVEEIDNSAELIEKLKSGDHQLLVYNTDENSFDIIPEDQLQVCGVIKSEDGTVEEETEVVQVITEGELLADENDGRTFYICEQGGVEEPEIMPEGSFRPNASSAISLIQDEEGNYYEFEEVAAEPTPLVVERTEIDDALGESKKRIKKFTSKRESKVIKAADLSELALANRKKPASELRCLETGCYFVGLNIGDLRKHLSVSHEMTLEEEVLVFQRYQDFMDWREDYERERKVSFIFRGGTKKISKDLAVTYLVCHRSGHYKPTMKDQSLRKRKMKPQGSCKMNGYCTAGIKLLKNIDTDETKCEICHTHYGHPLDDAAVPHLRANNNLRRIIWKKFEEGMSFQQVLEYLHHNPDGLEGINVLDRRAIRNLFDKFNKNTSVSVHGDTDGETGDQTSTLESDSQVNEPENTCTDQPICNDRHEKEESQPQVSIEQQASTVPEESVESEEVQKSATPTSNNNALEDANGELFQKEIADQPSTSSNPGTEFTLPSKKSKRLARPTPPAIPAKRRGRPSLKHKIVKQTSASLPASSPSAPLTPRRSARGRKPKVFADEEPPPKLSRATPDESTGSGVTTDVKRFKSPNPPLKKPTSTRPRGARRKLDRGDDSYSDVDGSKPPVLEKMDVSAQKDTRITLENLDPPTLVPAENVVRDNSDLHVAESENSVKPTSGKVRNRKLKSPRGSVSTSPKEEKLTSSPTALICEELQATIMNLLQHSESGPTVLLYKVSGRASPEYGPKDLPCNPEDFILVLQTPVQRQLLQMFPDVINVDGHHGKPKDLKLSWVLVLDEYREAIPAAWLISNAVNDRIISIFFQLLRQECQTLETECIMAPSKTSINYCALWGSVFGKKPSLLLNEDDTKRDLRVCVADEFQDSKLRRILNGLMNELMFATRETAFNETVETIEAAVELLENGEMFLKTFREKWLSKVEQWSLMHQLNKPVNTLFISDSFGKLKKFISFKGTKLLNTTVDPILKIGYDKCFTRSKRLLKGDQKLSRQMQEIETQHHIGCSSDTTTLESTSDDNHYQVRDDEKIATYTVLDLNSPCRCKLICPHCNVCAHKYVCSCISSSVNHQMCSHIHFVHMMVTNTGILSADAVDSSNEGQVLTTFTIQGDPQLFTLSNGDVEIREQSNQIVTTLCLPPDHEIVQVR